VNLIIKSNNCSVKEPCALCGEIERHADVPFAVFVEGTYEPVCQRCVNEQSPELGKFFQMASELWAKENSQAKVIDSEPF
jgi:hypothetical protein